MADTIAENLEKLRTLQESYDAISTDVAQIDQKTGDIATLIGEPAEGQESTLFAAIAAGGGGGDESGKQALVDAFVNAGVEATMDNTLYELSQKFTNTLVTSFDGWEWSKEITNPFEICYYATKVVIKGTSVNYLNSLAGFYSLIELNMPELTYFNPNGNSNRAVYPQYVYAPKMTTAPGTGYTFLNANLMKYISAVVSPFSNGKTLSNLYFYEFETKVNKSLNLVSWIGSSAVSGTSTNILTKKYYDDPDEPTDTFSYNIDKFLWYFKNHFMTSFSDMTGKTSPTLTLNAVIYNVITEDEEIMQYFADRNWTLASASQYGK